MEEICEDEVSLPYMFSCTLQALLSEMHSNLGDHLFSLGLKRQQNQGVSFFPDDCGATAI